MVPHMTLDPPPWEPALVNRQGFPPLTMRSTYEAKRAPGSVADSVTGPRPSYSPVLAWPGLTAPPAPAHPVSSTRDQK